MKAGRSKKVIGAVCGALTGVVVMLIAQTRVMANADAILRICIEFVIGLVVFTVLETILSRIFLNERL